MITWNLFFPFALISVLMSIIGSGIAAYSKQYSKVAVYCALGGIFVLSAFICGLWISLQRPPLRTMGETRLWYSFFMLLTGLFTYCRWKYRWILPYSTLMATIFMVINWVKPEIHDQSLMPALQSIWFIPHVIVYMFSYAMMGAVTLFVLYLWFRKSPLEPSKKEFTICDNLVRIGWGFLTLGMTMGALWAKDAWGDYWTWDPKETWALATWLSYLLYLHLRPSYKKTNFLFAWLIFSFILLQMCWWGINFLPAAQGSSIHSY